MRKGFRLLTKLGICPAGKDRRAMKRPTRKEKACTSRCENRTGSAYGRAVSTSSTVTEADILAEIIAPDKPGLDPDTARAVLRLPLIQKLDSDQFQIGPRSSHSTPPFSSRLSVPNSTSRPTAAPLRPCTNPSIMHASPHGTARFGIVHDRAQAT